MAKANVTLRMEPELKAEAAQLFQALGMDLSTATGIFYRQALRCHGLPFEVRLDAPEARMAADVELALDEADRYAAAHTERLSHETVFGSLREHLHGSQGV